MKKILLFLIIPFLSFGQTPTPGCMDTQACNFDSLATESGLLFTAPNNTGINMTIGMDQYSQHNLMIGDQIGAFILDEMGNYLCVGLTTFTGSGTALVIYGDDSTTAVQDGCFENELIYFFIEREISSNQFVVFFTQTSLIDFSTGINSDNTYSTNNVILVDALFVESYQFGCDYSCYGCIFELACNYDSSATINDGSCEYESCAGCMDLLACDYNPDATIPSACLDYVSCAGCTDTLSCNYGGVDITIDDGSCDYSCVGCMDPLGCNYDISAIIDCTLLGDSCCLFPDGICAVCSVDETGSPDQLIPCIEIILNDNGTPDDDDDDFYEEIIVTVLDWIVVDGEIISVQDTVYCENPEYNENYGNQFTDGTGLLVDNDSDNDTVCDDDDICPGGDDFVDDDNDNIPNTCDACPNDPDNDSDNDGVCGDIDICTGFDDLLDNDVDSIPNGCDTCPNDPDNDSDNDGICGDLDICPGSDDLVDTDFDGVPNGCDICPGSNDLVDTDFDGLPDGCDVCPNDPENDWDGDGLCAGDDPCSYDANNDEDGDGICGDVDDCPLDQFNDTLYPNGVCDNEEVFGCIDNQALNFLPTATWNDGSCIYCSSIDFRNNNNSIAVNDLHFEDAHGVTISFWAYDDDWSLSEENEDSFGYFIDFGSSNNNRYVIRWRDGVKGIQAYYEKNIDSIDESSGACLTDVCYTQSQTNATYIIPPFDYINNSDVYNWWEDSECGWKNITAVFCSNSIRLYVDGNIVQQSITNAYNPAPIFSLDSLDTKVVGANQFGEQSCDIKMDELRVWSRALSDIEVQERLGDNIDINLNIFAEEANNVGKLEGYWKFDSLSLRNELTNLLGVASQNTVFSNQYCNYNCDNYDYSTACFDNSNNDCDACTPSEGCMDPEADNYDDTADIDNGLCAYYGCMDNGMHDWSHIPGLEACNYDPMANINEYSIIDPQNPCLYPIDLYGLGYLDCDGNCLYDCDNDGACDWNQTHCYDTDGNLISNTDQINNVTFEIGPDGILDCLSFTYVDSVDNCVYNSGIDLVNNITMDMIPDGVPDCVEGFDYSTYSNPFQTDVDGDGIGNGCDDEDGGQLGCMDDGLQTWSLYPGFIACNYDFWADEMCDDCCEYCYLNDCEMYPSVYLDSTSMTYLSGPYDCLGYCEDLNGDGDPDDFDQDAICDMVDNCPNTWNPGQIDTDSNGIGDVCEESSLSMFNDLHYNIYPNPFSDYTIITFSNDSNEERLIRIFEVSGRLLYQKNTIKNMLKIYKSNFSAGLYILEISQNNNAIKDVLIVE